jgi:hypothetical protein
VLARAGNADHPLERRAQATRPTRADAAEQAVAADACAASLRSAAHARLNGKSFGGRTLGGGHNAPQQDGGDTCEFAR